MAINPDDSDLITIIKWHFLFYPMDINILYLKHEILAELRAVSRAPPSATWRDVS